MVFSSATDTITIWNSWTSNTSAVTTIQATGPVWKIWVDTGTTAGTASCVTDTIWTGWQTIQTGGVTHWNRLVPAVPIETEAERRARDERYRLAVESERKAAQKRDAAKARAMELLNSFLSQEQRESLRKERFFYVRAPSGRLYRIDQGTHGNLKTVDPQTRKVIERLCIQPGGVPEGDSMLTQKLMIETAEDALRAHANITLADGRVIHGEPALLDADRAMRFLPENLGQGLARA